MTDKPTEEQPFSQPDERQGPPHDALDFYDVSLLDTKAKERAAKACEDPISIFVKDIGFHWPQPVANENLKESLGRWVNGLFQPVTAIDQQVATKAFKFVVDWIPQLYPKASDEFMLRFGRLMVLGICLDDLQGDNSLYYQIADFCGGGRVNRLDFYHGRHTNWQNLLADTLQDMLDFYVEDDMLVANLFRSSIINSLIGWLIEHRLAKNDSILKSSSSSITSQKEGNSQQPINFPAFLRGKTGGAGAICMAIFRPTRNHKADLDAWIQCIPDMELFINGANDILSLPKEILAGENTNFLGLTARIRGGDSAAASSGTYNMRDALQKLCKVTKEAVLRVDAQLAHLDDKLELWRVFRHGYVAFHLTSPRYGLQGVSEKFPKPVLEEKCAEPVSGRATESTLLQDGGEGEASITPRGSGSPVSLSPPQ